MKKAIIAASLALAGTLCLSANPLSPQAALSRATATTLRMAPTASAPMTLAATFTSRTDAEAAAVYVFTPAQGQGFLIVGADDLAPAVLGYSDSSTFNPDTMPANVAFWIQQYADAVGAAAASHRRVAAPAAPAEYAPIEPLCSTAWSQAAPYNNDCPRVDGRRAVTGCIATAMAQIMKHYNWPERGTGSHTTTFSYSGQPYSVSYDFDSHPFDWDNMLPRYSFASSGTATQRAAVSNLMLACGVAADMNYTPDGSGAALISCARGLLRNLRYDRSLCYTNREFYEPAEWVELLYNELAANRPVLYTGDDGQVGHAFVCDGYSAEAFFHINWGWNGEFDGYYLITDLNPEGTGIGGGSGEAGYNFNNTVLINFMPEKEGSLPTPMVVVNGELSAPEINNDRNPSTNFRLTNAIYNMGIEGFTFTLGLQLVDKDGNDRIISMDESFYVESFDPFTQFLSVPSMEFPVGEYDVYPVYKTTETPWTRAKVFVARTSDHLHVLVSDTRISVIDGTFDSDIFGKLVAIWPLDDFVNGIYPGFNYQFEYHVTNKEAWAGQLQCLIIDPATEQVVASSQIGDREFDEMGLRAFSAFVTLPADLTPGDYAAILVVPGSEPQVVSDASLFTVEEAPHIFIPELTAVDPSNEDGTLMYRGETYRCSYDITSNKPWSGNICLRLLKKNVSRYTTVAESEPVAANFDDGLFSGTWVLSVPENASNGTNYLALYIDNSGTWEMIGGYIRVKVSQGSGIEAVNADHGAPAAYYDITGRRIDSPAKGVTISVDANGKATKIVY